MSQSTRIQLTGRAMRYVQLLQDLGHLDGEGANRLMVGVGELTKGEVADLPDIRRAAAMLLFTPVDVPGADALLLEDWPILFS